MSYVINNSRGQIVAVIQDGTVNTTATPLTFVGRGVTSYGTYENDNYLWLLENFASPDAPPNAVLGQLWYDSSADTLNVYNSSNLWSTIATTSYVNDRFTNGTLNINTSAAISAVGNITGGNVNSVASVSAGGNVYGNNFIASGNVSANTIIANNIVSSGSSPFKLPNLNQAQIDALSAQNGDMVYNTSSNLPQIYQNGAWNNFTISYYT